jgi:hypothetical protein
MSRTSMLVHAQDQLLDEILDVGLAPLAGFPARWLQNASCSVRRMISCWSSHVRFTK